MRVGIVHNTAAGSRAVGRGRALEREIAGHGLYAAPESRDALAAVAARFRDAGIEVLAISGGDGTLHATLSAFRDVYGDAELPIVELLRGGTMNTVADALRLPRRASVLTSRLVARTIEGGAPRTTARATIDCEGRLAFLFGIGVVPGFLEAYYATGRPSPVTASRVLGRAMIESLTGGPLFARLTTPTHFETTFDEGLVWPMGPGLALSAGTIDDIGLGFRPFHRAHETSKAMHCLRVDATSAEFVRELPRIRRARPMSPKAARDQLTRGFTIRARDGRLRYVMDGDIYESASSSLRVDVGPTLRFVTYHR